MALRKAFSLLLIVLVMAACAPRAEETQEAPQIDLAAEELAVRDINIRWLVMANERDAAGIAALFMENGTTQANGEEPVVGRAAIQADVETSNAENPSRVLDWSTDHVLIASSGDLAVDFGSWSQTGGGADGSVEDWGKYVTVVQKIDGEWLIYSDTSISLKPVETNEDSSQ